MAGEIRVACSPPFAGVDDATIASVLQTGHDQGVPFATPSAEDLILPEVKALCLTIFSSVLDQAAVLELMQCAPPIKACDEAHTPEMASSVRKGRTTAVPAEHVMSNTNSSRGGWACHEASRVVAL